MSVRCVLLGLLEKGSSHGYDLKRDYDRYFGRRRPLPFGQVYATLGRLVRDGLVTPGEVESGDGPDRKRYAITDDGRNELAAWLDEPSDVEPHLQTEIYSKIVLSLMLGRSPSEHLDAQRASHLQRRKELTEFKRTGSLADALLADYGLFHLEADLRWIDITEARLSALAEEVQR